MKLKILIFNLFHEKKIYVKLKMDQGYFDEITSILAMHGRPDLIATFRENIKVDEDYRPPTYMKKEKLSDDEGSAEEESDYEVEIDSNGFQSLK